jgi:serpin B
VAVFALWKKSRSPQGRARRRGKHRGVSDRGQRLNLEPLETRWLMTASPLAANSEAAAEAIDAFGMDLYKTLQSQAGGSGNMFLSPLSISTALAMAYAGARGETATQMADVLHLGDDPQNTAEEFGALLADLNGAGQGDSTLSVADALWGQQGLPFLSQFLDTMQSDYGGGLKQVDFEGAPESARGMINDWVAQHTNDKITNLFGPGSIDMTTRLVLANAIYFQGDWATAFDKSATDQEAFTLAGGSDEQVSMMHTTSNYRYMQSDGFQVLELPYAGGRLAMDVMLPTSEAGASNLSVGQLPGDLNAWLQGLSTQQVIVSLPKFTLNTQYGLNDLLGTLGMTDAFKNYADFSGIVDPAIERLKIEDVVHKAYLDVGETGTEAAAATGVSMVMCCEIANSAPAPPVVFDANHPFMFMIRDTVSGSVLFMGQEANPLQKVGDASAPGISSAAVPSAPPPTVSNPADANAPFVGPRMWVTILPTQGVQTPAPPIDPWPPIFVDPPIIVRPPVFFPPISIFPPITVFPPVTVWPPITVWPPFESPPVIEWVPVIGWPWSTEPPIEIGSPTWYVGPRWWWPTMTPAGELSASTPDTGTEPNSG